MSKETLKTEDELTLILYDERGRVKLIRTKNNKSKLEKLLELAKRVLGLW